MIAFLIPNEKSTKPLQTHIVSVDSVEGLIGIDFFPELPDSIESRLESKKTYLGGLFFNSHCKPLLPIS